jgi:hypothetical protein
MTGGKVLNGFNISRQSAIWFSFRRTWISFRLRFDFLPPALISCGSALNSFPASAARVRLVKAPPASAQSPLSL